VDFLSTSEAASTGFYYLTGRRISRAGWESRRLFRPKSASSAGCAARSAKQAADAIRRPVVAGAKRPRQQARIWLAIGIWPWYAVARAAKYSLTGALIIEEAVKQAGRPITLAAGEDRAGLATATLAALQVLNAITGWQGAMTLADRQTFTVAFREEGLAAEPVLFAAPGGVDDGWGKITLKLQTV